MGKRVVNDACLGWVFFIREGVWGGFVIGLFHLFFFEKFAMSCIGFVFF